MPSLRNVKVDWVSLVDRAAVRDPQNKSEPRRFLLAKREGATPPPDEGGTMPVDEALTKAHKERDDALAEVKKLEARAPSEGQSGDRFPGDGDLDRTHDLSDLKRGGPTKGPDDLDKEDESEDQTQKSEQVSKAEFVELRKRAERAEEIAKAERDARVTGEFITKAESDYQKLPADAHELGPVLKRASEQLSKDDFEYLERLLKGADTAIEQGDLFTEAGRSTAARKPTGSQGELRQKAEEIRKADPSISMADAELKAMLNNPDLQRAHLSEMGSYAGR